MRAKTEQYVCTETGHQITVLTEIDKEEPIVEYHGVVGIMGQGLPFKIDADDLNDAFNKFVASANAAVEEMQKEMQEQHSLVDINGQGIGKPKSDPIIFPGG